MSTLASKITAVRSAIEALNSPEIDELLQRSARLQADKERLQKDFMKATGDARHKALVREVEQLISETRARLNPLLIQSGEAAKRAIALCDDLIEAADAEAWTRFSQVAAMLNGLFSAAIAHVPCCELKPDLGHIFAPSTIEGARYATVRDSLNSIRADYPSSLASLSWNPAKPEVGALAAVRQVRRKASRVLESIAPLEDGAAA